jgi:NAD(P)-dependent dehydrogenase (short-subunit alcohol dehydrogenase family)
MQEKKTAIVTGASHGIGAGLVGAFLKEGYFVVAALAFTLPLQSQQSAIGDSTEVSASVSQPASAASKQAQQVDQDLGIHSAKWGDCWHQGWYQIRPSSEILSTVWGLVSAGRYRTFNLLLNC